MWINGARGGDRLGSTNRLPAGDERLRYSYQRLTHLGHRRRFREIASLPQAAPCPPLVRFCARRELDRWLHSSIVSERFTNCANAPRRPATRHQECTECVQGNKRIEIARVQRLHKEFVEVFR